MGEGLHMSSFEIKTETKSKSHERKFFDSPAIFEVLLSCLEDSIAPGRIIRDMEDIICCRVAWVLSV